MKLVSFFPPGETDEPYLGILEDDHIDDFGIPASDVLLEILGAGRTDLQGLRWYLHMYAIWRAISEVKLCAPLPMPTSLRDFYAFEQHVKAANQNWGREVPSAWYEFLVFYSLKSMISPRQPIADQAYTRHAC